MDEWQTTTDVLERLHDFDERSAWELLVLHFREPVVGLGRRMGLSSAEAEDAAQETLLAFAEAYRAKRYDRSKGRLKHWLFGIARRQVSSARRRLAADLTRAEGTDGDASLGGVAESSLVSDPDALWEEEWERAVYERALIQVRREVSPGTFAIFRSLCEGKTPDEIAAEIGVSRTKVYNVKHRVTKRLAELAAHYEEG